MVELFAGSVMKGERSVAFCARGLWRRHRETRFAVTFLSRNAVNRRSGRHRCSMVQLNREPVGTRKARTDGNTPVLCENRGSIVGATLLISGCAIGAGMLALPARTVGAGLIPTETIMLGACAYNMVSSLLFLEASNTVALRMRDSNHASNSSGTKADAAPLSLVLLAEKALPVSQPASAAIWIMQLALLECYTVEGSHLVASVFHSANTWACGTAFAGFLGAILCFCNAHTVDITNRVLVGGLVLSYVALMGLLSSAPSAMGDLVHFLTTPAVTSTNHWGELWPAGVSVCLVAFQSQCVTPAVHQYLGGDMRRARTAILLGHIVPFVMYSTWECVLLRALGIGAAENAAIQELSPVEALISMLQSSGAVPLLGDDKTLTSALVFFSLFAVSSSFIGLGISLRDMLTSLVQKLSPTTKNDQSLHRKVLSSANILACLVLVAPAVLTTAEGAAICNYILDRFGMLGALAINGVLPAVTIAALSSTSNQFPSYLLASERKHKQLVSSEGDFSHSKIPTFAAAAGMGIASVALLVPESMRVAADILLHH